MPTIAEVKRLGVEILSKVNSDSAMLDAEILLGFVLNLSKAQLIVRDKQELSTADRDKFLALIEQRAKHCPIAYLIGEKEFYSYAFKVNKNVLIPRPETESLVEKVLETVAKSDNLSETVLVEVGTGSAAIIISLVNELRKKKTSFAKNLAIDISAEALEVAKANAAFYNIENEISFYHGDLLRPIQDTLMLNKSSQRFCFIANLPYISEEAILPVDVEMYEPRLALRTGNKGLEIIYRLLSEIRTFCDKGQADIFLEFGFDQKEVLEEYFVSQGHNNFEFFRDLQGHWRFVKVCI
ncbi:MAG: peptide chain release factor N(5)-glutamine methyltransferase [Proteobacteria bacterium]|nr:peptide chain release factor N(5)-glutamine methyltransferase [Pseudomonadota bacterium]